MQQQFFPASDRPAFLVDLTLPQSSSIAATQAQVDRVERAIKDDRDVVRTTSYVGEGAVRSYLSLDPNRATPSTPKSWSTRRTCTPATA